MEIWPMTRGKEQIGRTISVNLKFDLRSPVFGAPSSTLFPTSVAMAEYADRNGVHSISLSEHHGSGDGYLPSPIVLGASIAAVTRRCRLRLSALIAPLYNPVRLAEDLAVLDNISGGRVSVVLAAGYVPQEFRMIGKSMARRGARTEEIIGVLRKAWLGEPFEYNGTQVVVTPRPVQPSIPLYMGGSTPAAARRAGRIADGFVTHRVDLHEIYREQADLLGRVTVPFEEPGPGFVHVADDPDEVWRRIVPHALHETNAYGAWAEEAGVISTYRPVDSPETLRSSGSYAVVTPKECIALAKMHGRITLNPLMGGMDPDLGWNGLQTFFERVFPAITDCSAS